MKASKLIAELQVLLKEHGDLPIYFSQQDGEFRRHAEVDQIFFCENPIDYEAMSIHRDRYHEESGFVIDGI